MTDEFIFEILKKFNSSEIVSLELSRGDASINLKKAEGIVNNSASMLPIASMATTSPSVFSNNIDGGKVISEKKDLDDSKVLTQEIGTTDFVKTEIIKSPIVGTFYRAPSPDAPAFTEVGRKVKKGDALCVLEAMKMMNTLDCEFDCEVVKVLANNGDLVEFDQPLFEVKKL